MVQREEVVKKKNLIWAVIASVLTITYYVWMILAWIHLDNTVKKSKSSITLHDNNAMMDEDIPYVEDLPDIDEENQRLTTTKIHLNGEQPPNYSFWIKEPKYRCNSVLKVNTSRDASYVIKFVDPYDGEVILMCYLPSGVSQEIDLPSGTFEIRYTCGTEWFGNDKMFGDKGAYAKADHTFQFSEGSGYELTLYRVRNGNLHTSIMRKEDF